jgi:hypothetical protein
MPIATDPASVSLEDSDDEFKKHFDEFATGKAPDPEEPKEPGEPEGNDPEEKPTAPADGAATEESKTSDDVTSGEAPDEGGDQPPETQQAPDPWAGVPDEARERIAQIEKERDEAKHKAQSDASRVAALSRKLQQLTVATPAPQAPAEPTEAQKALDEKVKQLRSEYGEIADPLIELIENQRKELNDVRTTLTGLSQEHQAQVIATETQALEARHPDWRDIAQSTDFQGWIEIQPKNIQNLAASWDARETSVVLTLFKAERAQTTGPKEEVATPAPKADAATDARRSQQLEGGRDVRSRPAPAASGPPEEFDAAFEFYAKQRAAKEAAARR